MQFLAAEVLPDAGDCKGAIRGSCQLGTNSKSLQKVRLELHILAWQVMLTPETCIAKGLEPPRCYVTIVPSSFYLEDSSIPLLRSPSQPCWKPGQAGLDWNTLASHHGTLVPTPKLTAPSTHSTITDIWNSSQITPCY